MKNRKKHLSLVLVLTLALCLSLAACSSGRYDNDDDGIGTPESFEGMVKDSQLLANYAMYWGTWLGEDGSELTVEMNDSGDEVRYALYDAYDGVTASGYIQTVPEYCADYFYNEHDGWAYHSWLDEDAALHIDSFGAFTKLNDDMLLPVEDIPPQEPYFTRNGLGINAAAEMGTFLLEDGVCSYSGLGDGYNTDDCYWEVTRNYDQTHDGIREIQFDAICYIPEGSIPYFDQEYVTVTSSELYDFYTGMWLTAATTYGNSQRGENYCLHTVSWQENSYLIEFAYSTDWQYNVGDWAQVLTKSYVVYMPEDYDGLVFAAEAQPWDYKDSAKRMQLDSISPEADVMNIDTLAPYSSLYFSICY